MPQHYHNPTNHNPEPTAPRRPARWSRRVPTATVSSFWHGGTGAASTRVIRVGNPSMGRLESVITQRVHTRGRAEHLGHRQHIRGGTAWQQASLGTPPYPAPPPSCASRDRRKMKRQAGGRARGGGWGAGGGQPVVFFVPWQHEQPDTATAAPSSPTSPAPCRTNVMERVREREERVSATEQDDGLSLNPAVACGSCQAGGQGTVAVMPSEIGFVGYPGA